MSTIVCLFKTWHGPAVQTFYQEISLSGDKIKLLRRQLSMDEKERGVQLGHGQWAKKLRICYDYISIFDKSSEDDEDSVKLNNELILSYVPNIKQIDFASSYHFDHYMAILRDTSCEYLRFIKELVPLDNSDEYNRELYFSVSYKFRNTFTHLLDVDYSTEFVDHSQYGDILFVLPQFTHLTHLSIENVHDEELTFLQILDLCDNLVSLTFFCGFPLPDSAEFNHTSPLSRNRHLKILDIEVPNFTAPYELMESCISTCY